MNHSSSMDSKSDQCFHSGKCDYRPGREILVHYGLSVHTVQHSLPPVYPGVGKLSHEQTDLPRIFPQDHEHTWTMTSKIASLILSILFAYASFLLGAEVFSYF